MSVSPIANAVSAAILQKTQAATAASVASLAARASGNAAAVITGDPPTSSPSQYAGSSTSLLDLTA